MAYYSEDDIKRFVGIKGGGAYPILKKGAKPIDVEPNKDRQVAQNTQEAMERNNNIPKGVNKEAWKQSIAKVEELQKELPKVEQLVKQFNGQGVIITAEPFIDKRRHDILTADGDTDPKTGEIRINTLTRLSDTKSMEELEKACAKSGRLGKYGKALSSEDIRHTMVHEYGHIIQLALCCKENNKNRISILGDYTTHGTAGEMIQIACSRTGVTLKQFQTNLSAYASKHLGETFSEAIANAVLSKEKNATALELWKMVKEKLG